MTAVATASGSRSAMARGAGGVRTSSYPGAAVTTGGGGGGINATQDTFCFYGLGWCTVATV